jgi:hypothetical protein
LIAPASGPPSRWSGDSASYERTVQLVVAARLDAHARVVARLAAEHLVVARCCGIEAHALAHDLAPNVERAHQHVLALALDLAASSQGTNVPGNSARSTSPRQSCVARAAGGRAGRAGR